MTSLARLWSELAGHAMLLDLDRLRATIVATMDDGLRAASYDGAGGRSADVSSHPERMALSDRRDPTRADLGLLEHHEARYVAAVGELCRRSHSRGVPTDWDDAVKHAHLLDEMDAITVLETTGQRPARWVHQAGDALHDLELLAGRHVARQATRDERDWTADLGDNDVCAWHVAIHRRYRRPRVPGKNICADCVALVLAGKGERPPVWLLEAEVDRGSRPKAWTAALSRWLDELGIARSA